MYSQSCTATPVSSLVGVLFFSALTSTIFRAPLQMKLRQLLLITIATACSANNLAINLEAPWSKTSFDLNLLETVAAHNESHYVPTILKLFQLEDDDEDDEVEFPTDETKYHLVIKSFDLNVQSFINFDLVNKVHSPRIQAQYEYYRKVIEPEFTTRLAKECTTDSFGRELLTSPDDKLSSWVLYNTHIYCSVDDVYALRTDKSYPLELQEFDRVIGENQDAPILVLYSNPNSEEFVPLFDNLYQSSVSGKIRFVWRYIPDEKDERDTLSGFGLVLTSKRSDYIVIDDKDVKSGKKNSKSTKNFKLEKDLKKIIQSTEVNSFDEDNLGLKLSSFVLSNPYKDISKYELLQVLLLDLPKFASYISQSTKQRSYDPLKDQVVANEEVGASTDSYGIYVNGAPIHKLELDIFTLINKIKVELNFVNQLVALGFTPEQSKFFLAKFALLSAVKQSQFRNGNTVMGFNENRFKLYEHAFVSGNFKKKSGVVFFNDIEKDGTYERYTSNREEAYLQSRLQPSQIPPLRENVHDVIFALNFSNKGQLRVFFTLSKMILDSGIPQQLGAIALSEDPLDDTLARVFYFISDTTTSQEALAFLYKFYETKDDIEVELLLKSIKIPTDYEFNPDTYKNTLEKFSITAALIIFNGVIHELRSPTWQISMGQQLTQDISLLKNYISTGKAYGKSLKSLLYENARSERNLRVLPLDPSEVIYKLVNAELLAESIAFKPSNLPQGDTVSGTFWIIGDMQKQLVVDQLIEILNKVRRQPHPLQVRVLNTGVNFPGWKKIQKLNLSKLATKDIDAIINILRDETPTDNGKNSAVLALLERNNLPIHHDFVLLNSRYFRLSSILTSKDLDLSLEYEFNQRISIFTDLVNAYPEVFKYKFLNELNIGTYDSFDWFDLLTSILTKSFYLDDKSFITDVSRFDFSSLEMKHSLDIFKNDPSKEIDILLIIDPTDELTQKLISIVNSVKDMNMVNVKILFQPKLGEPYDIGRFYAGVFPSSLPSFKEGEWIVQNTATIANLPESEIFSSALDVPSRWISVVKSSDVDLDNIKIENLLEKDITAVFELKGLLLEGFATDVSIARAPKTSVSLEISQYGKSSDTLVLLATQGYFQLQAGPGTWELKIQSGNYSMLSASKSKFIINNEPIEIAEVSLFELSGSKLQLRLKPKTDFLNDVVPIHDNPEVVNIFSVVSGHLYERLISIMMLSVREHTKNPVKFWIIENFVSGNFKKVLPLLAATHNFEYQFVTYKWPAFLRQQKEKQREIWGYKILFLDLLFPQTLDKVIFVDADQIARADMSELNQIDLQGKPYAFTPMCDSREEMEGFRFWKLGYWLEVLGDDLKYHISALFVVDLQRFRELHAGDKLRSHYQKLLSDPASLLNLDQDLPNNLQRKLPIYSLPQEWLWCETWCSSDTLFSAKSIDLCNNPLTKENKLDQARRLIPEWTTYDDKVDVVRQTVEKLQTIDVQNVEDDNYIDHDEL